MRDDFYKVLGLEPRASQEQIETAYRFCIELYGEGALATSALLEPDEAEDQRRSVDEAYRVLSDPDSRRAYHQRRGLPPPEAAAPPIAAAASRARPETASLPPLAAARQAAVSFSQAGPVLAEIADRRLASLLAPASANFEAFRVLRTKLPGLAGERRCLGLVAATAHEGTSGLAVGLAGALAQRAGQRVLLVEARLRAPALERKLGLVAAPGLGEWLQGPATESVPVRRVEPWGFDLLTAGAPAPQATELLVCDSMRRLLDAARAAFDAVLLDCPPLQPVADSVLLQDLLDGFLLVVRARHATRQSIREALAQLRPGAVRGVVFNDRTEILARWLERRRPRTAS